ncbi:MAG: GFA family protein [Acidobacteria bacterium]|nr:GFA family protein [Acidobacteriota bacterium]
MIDEKTLATGGCMCRAVRYEAIGEPLEVGYCHCHSCRRHTGAPVVTFVMFEADNVRFTGRKRGVYNSSPGVKRAFCGNCGTSLSWEGNYEGRLLCALQISTFDDPDSLTPTAHSFYPERISWFDIADNLPRHEGFVADSPLLHHGPAIEEPSG